MLLCIVRNFCSSALYSVEELFLDISFYVEINFFFNFFFLFLYLLSLPSLFKVLLTFPEDINFPGRHFLNFSIDVRERLKDK